MIKVNTVLDNQTIEITDIAYWTLDRKLQRNSPISLLWSVEQKKIRFYLDYENQSTDHSVYFKVHLKPGYLSTAQWSESEVDKIEKDFKLTTTKYTSLTNIHLYNEHNTITKYNDVETITMDYAEVRLKLYAKRKEYQLSNLDHEIKVISAKCKFILDIIEESIIIQKRTKQNIIEQLESRGLS